MEGVLCVEDWAEIRRLHRAEQMPVKAIARVMGVSRNTVRAAVASDRPPKYQRPRKGSIVDAVEPRIRELLKAYPAMPATVIAERIGWERSVRVLRDRVARAAPGLSSAGPCVADGVCGGRDRPVRLLVPAGHAAGRVRAGAPAGAAAGADHGVRVLPVADPPCLSRPAPHLTCSRAGGS